MSQALLYQVLLRSWLTDGPQWLWYLRWVAQGQPPLPVALTLNPSPTGLLRTQILLLLAISWEIPLNPP